MTFFVLLLTLLAALRLTRLAIHDVISRPFRYFLESREASHPSRRWSMLVQLFDCPWCIGFWISAALAAAELDVANPLPSVSLWFVYPVLTLALSWLVGFGYTAMYTLELYDPPQHQH